MLTKKERAILYVLKNAAKVSKIKLVKLMFLISEKTNFYSFVPYDYGPFSFELYNDLSHLEKEGYISMDNKSIVPIKKNIPSLDRSYGSIIAECSRRFLNYNDAEILEYIYSNYPQYTIFSLYDKRMSYEKASSGIVTIGYEEKSIDYFLYELIFNKIGAVFDVRMNAYSMKFGIPSEQRRNLASFSDYKALFADYEKELDEKTACLERIKETAKKKKVALMCFEKDVRYCHRGIIAEKLRKDRIEVNAQSYLLRLLQTKLLPH
jgi:uncharacterized protein (DUF488 family)